MMNPGTAPNFGHTDSEDCPCGMCALTRSVQESATEQAAQQKQANALALEIAEHTLTLAQEKVLRARGRQSLDRAQENLSIALADCARRFAYLIPAAIIVGHILNAIILGR